jgi:hypothetical protein
MKIGKYDEAIADYSRINKSYSNYEAACTNLAAAKQALKDSKK